MEPRENRRWTLTGEALERLLDHLGPEREAAAREYARLRSKLADYFDFRGSPLPDADADEVLDRVARKLEAGEAIQRVANYAYGVAKWVVLESRKRQARERVALDTLELHHGSPHLAADTERPVECMQMCLDQLPEESRTLVVTYYKEATASSLDGRKLLAQRLGLTYGTLKTRVHRIRGRLEPCLRDCLRARGIGSS